MGYRCQQRARRSQVTGANRPAAHLGFPLGNLERGRESSFQGLGQSSGRLSLPLTCPLEPFLPFGGSTLSH